MEENNHNKEVNNEENGVVKNQNRKSIPLVLIIAILLITIILIIFLVKIPKKINKDKDTNDIATETETNENKENNKILTAEEEKTATESINSCLKDDAWLKDNISFNTENNTTEEIAKTCTFYVINNENYAPIVIIKAVQDDDSGSMQGFLVTYKDGKVASSEISNYRLNSKNNKSTIKVNPENGIVGFFEDFDNGNQHMMYSVLGGKSKKLDVYGYCEGGEHEGKWYFLEEYWRDVPTVEKDKYNAVKEKYDKYEYKDIDIELTSENIDLYVE